MHQITWQALLLLVCTACAHQAGPAATSSQGRPPAPELGRLSVVPVGPAQDSHQQRDATRPSMALASQGDPSASHAGEPATPRNQESDSELRLRQRIQKALSKNSSLSYTAQRVSVAVRKQTVVLEGDVRTERERLEVQAIVEKIEGVRRVTNRLAVVEAREAAREPN